MTLRTPAIVVDNVVKRFGAVEAIRGVSFDVARGELVGLIGPDGAGKTTLVRLLCGLLRPDGGRVRVLGRDPVAEHRAITAAVGYLSQRFSLYGDLTIDENIAFFAEIHRVGHYAERRDRLLTRLGLEQFRDRRADRLSGGMRQKLALACTLVHEPEILLLDEPTTGVDPVSRRELWKLLSELVPSGLTVLLTTPYLDEAERCARVALLHEGRLLAVDDPAALRARLGGTVIEIASEAYRAVPAVVAGVAGVLDVQIFGDRVHVRMTDGAEGRARIERALAEAGLAGARVRAIPAALEDVFIDRIARAEAGRG
jgi:ABC-2 type transport system ATP-binding protein